MFKIKHVRLIHPVHIASVPVDSLYAKGTAFDRSIPTYSLTLTEDPRFIKAVADKASDLEPTLIPMSNVAYITLDETETETKKKGK